MVVKENQVYAKLNKGKDNVVDGDSCVGVMNTTKGSSGIPKTLQGQVTDDTCAAPSFCLGFDDENCKPMKSTDLSNGLIVDEKTMPCT